MFRVLLKVDKVQLRIKQTVEIHLVIRKNHKNFTHCRKQFLVNGQVDLNANSEFFVAQLDPTFDLEIYLIKGDLKKKGGIVPLDLNKYAINFSHRITAPIKQSPLTHSHMLIDFVYMKSERAFSTEPMVSLHELQSLNHRNNMECISRQNDKLIEQKDRLHLQIHHLKEKNLQLQGQNRMLQENYNLKEKEYQKEMGLKEREKQETFKCLEQEKRKIADIVGKINDSGDPGLIEEMGDIISQMQAENEHN